MDQPLASYLIPTPAVLLKAARLESANALPKKQEPVQVKLRQRKPSTEAQTGQSDAHAHAPLSASQQVDQLEKERAKLQLAMWKCFTYVLTVVVGIYTLSQDTWWKEPELYFKGYPHLTTRTMKVYYNIGFGNYAYQLYTLFYEPKQSDFWAMFTHHICTLVVMGVSYSASFTRIGAVILLLHDLADPIMVSARLVPLDCERMPMADIFFGIFAFTFLVTRNFIFPYYVISACIPYGLYEDGARMPRGYAEYFWICVACLWLLQALNLNWGYLICKMVVKTLTEGKVEKDIRDD
ncbi:TLC domain-containing protein [Chytriomyces sp. MP71]|nr:TLC domain-containing protein [Chytriomyces sp. MP71]